MAVTTKLLRVPYENQANLAKSYAITIWTRIVPKDGKSDPRLFRHLRTFEATIKLTIFNTNQRTSCKSITVSSLFQPATAQRNTV